MLRTAKALIIKGSRLSGLSAVVGRSQWRQSRLLILCYHGIALEDEHEWDDQLYMSAPVFEQRMRFLQESGYRVLGLGEGVRRLREGTLPPKSVAITIDDGAYDCYRQAYPILRRFSFPFTVYLTTFYCDYNRPIFRLVCSYMLWKQRGRVVDGRGLPGLAEIDMRTLEGRQRVVACLDTYTKQNKASAEEKDALAAQLAERIGFDYPLLLRKRILHLMKPEEVRELAAAGVDIQLHTHRHRTPREESLFFREINDNRQRIQDWTGHHAEHFCYPSGVHHPEFPGWLRASGVATATTCASGLASRQDDPLLLPRVVDHSSLTLEEFGSWMTGLRALLPLRPHQAVDPNL